MQNCIRCIEVILLLAETLNVDVFLSHVKNFQYLMMKFNAIYELAVVLPVSSSVDLTCNLIYNSELYFL